MAALLAAARNVELLKPSVDLVPARRGETDLVHPRNVRRVLENTDPVVRNLQITQSYHELTVALDPFFGGTDVLWTGFATWASKQAGQFIRGDVAARLRRFVERYRARSGGEGPLGRMLQRGPLVSYLEAAVDEVSRNVAEGNRRVYAKLAPLYADFLVLARSRAGYDRRRRELFLRRIAADPTSDERLVKAFGYYYDALTEHDPKRRAELVYLGNLLVGWHEQIRLQDPIDGALTAPIRQVMDCPGRFWDLPQPVARAANAVLRTVLLTALRHFEADWRRVATQGLMCLALPTVCLELGEDVPPLSDGTTFPDVLADLRHPDAAVLLEALGAGDDSAADDWSDLGDRMRYVVSFFRSRQRERALLQRPYDAMQVASIRAGRVPGGEL